MATKPGGKYIDNLPDTAGGAGYYELNSTCDEYLAFHYPGEDPLAVLLGEGAPAYAERLPFGLKRLWEPCPDGVALDAGAAVGRVTFDLARDHKEAWGIDYSRALMRTARRVQRTGRARYRTVYQSGAMAICIIVAILYLLLNGRVALVTALGVPLTGELAFAPFSASIPRSASRLGPPPPRALRSTRGRALRPGLPGNALARCRTLHDRGPPRPCPRWSP